jgi:membrane protease YdiL (CAAX protease family)
MTISLKTKRLLGYYLKLWGLYILFFITAAILTSIYPELAPEKYKQEFLNLLLKENPLQLFILAVIFAPIIEEMMFRTLIKPSHTDIILLLCSWPLFYINGFLPDDVHWAIKTGFIALCLVLQFYIVHQLIPAERTIKLRGFLTKYYIPVLIVSSLLFGLVHINNYVDGFMINAALVLLIVPRILSGFMMGMIKIKNEGIGWSMGLHAMNNGFVVGIMILAQ